MKTERAPGMRNPYFRRAAGLGDLLGKARNPLLGHLDVELTERCNNNCIHCYINRPADDWKARALELDTAELESLLQEAADLGCLSVRLTGGEPLLRDDFPKVYLHARKLGMRVDLVTNATLVTRDIARLLSRVPPLGSVEVTIYGMTPRTYERVSRTSGAFDAAWQGIERLLEEGIPFQPRAYLTGADEEEKRSLRTWVSSLPHRPDMPTWGGLLYLRGRRDSEVRNRAIRALRLPPGQCVDEMEQRSGCHGAETRNLLSRLQRSSGPGLFLCGAGKGSACLDAYGTLQPCILLRHPSTAHKVGQRGATLETVMKTEFPALRSMEAENPRFLERCARCFLRGFCDQCPAHSWMEHGTLDTPVDYLCDIAHEEARRLGLLTKGEKAWNAQDGEKRLDALVGQRPGPRTHTFPFQAIQSGSPSALTSSRKS